MTASMQYAKVIRIKIRMGNKGVWNATSPDLRGLAVVSKDREKLEKVLVPQAIYDLFEACGVQTILTLAEASESEYPDTWVALPAQAARNKLDELAKAS